MRKSKGQTVDLLYTKKEEPKTNKKKKSTTKRIGTSNANSKKNRKSNKKTKKSNNEIINLDNEIIIGLTPKKEEVKRPAKNKKQKTKKEQKTKDNKNKKKGTKRKQDSNKKKNNQNKIKKQKVKNKKNLKFVKWISIIILIVAIVILFMMSSLFNIKQIVVLNNNKISSEEIINLSKLTIGINMFKTTNKTIRNNIKENAYIEDVSIKRNINGTVTLDVKERTPTYILKFADKYAYINNQGYILEISEAKLELPIITGFQTSDEEIIAGNRLVVEDLNKLADVIKIMESAKNSSLADIITEIDISDSTNYILIIASESKTVQFGDVSNINIKLQMINQVINSEKGITGEIYFQEDAKKAVFREKV